MAPTTTSTAITTRNGVGGTPYQLDQSQLLKATTALLAHIKSHSPANSKPNLLGPLPTSSSPSSDASSPDDENEVQDSDSPPLWLILTTKKHIADKTRLKPGKIPLPHPLLSTSTSPSSSTPSNLQICLITADPHTHYKSLLASPTFPSGLASQITRVIPLSKLRLRYKTYETKRQLFAEHDVFLADDRIVTSLPSALGKVFYGTSAKRPVPISITGRKAASTTSAGKEEGSGEKIGEKKKAKREVVAEITAEQLAREVEKALGSALVYLSPSTCTSVRVGRASWAPQKVAENVAAVVEGLVGRFVPGGWRGVRSLHVKGERTVALPVWMSGELWSDEADVLEESEVVEAGRIEEGKEGGVISSGGKKRKRGGRGRGGKKDGAGEEAEGGEEGREAKKVKGADASEGDELAKELKLRQARLQKQKAEAKREVDAEEGGVVVEATKEKVKASAKGKKKSAKATSAAVS